MGKSFCDVQFTQLCKDPMAVVRGIYRHFDKKLSPEAERQMETYLKNNKRFKHGKPLVDLEGTFGVTERDMKLNAFVDYTKAFVMQKQQQQPTSPGALGDEGESAVKG
uniref:Uncharacterized protein n=1 Tax=Lotharella globosa TaxID=91324 RepID=A0A7S4DX27_9EUKA